MSAQALGGGGGKSLMGAESPGRGSSQRKETFYYYGASGSLENCLETLLALGSESLNHFAFLCILQSIIMNTNYHGCFF